MCVCVCVCVFAKASMHTKHFATSAAVAAAKEGGPEEEGGGRGTGRFLRCTDSPVTRIQLPATQAP